MTDPRDDDDEPDITHVPEGHQDPVPPPERLAMESPDYGDDPK